MLKGSPSKGTCKALPFTAPGASPHPVSEQQLRVSSLRKGMALGVSSDPPMLRHLEGDRMGGGDSRENSGSPHMWPGDSQPTQAGSSAGACPTTCQRSRACGTRAPPSTLDLSSGSTPDQLGNLGQVTEPF